MERLREIAEAATAGPWRWGSDEEYATGGWPDTFLVSAQMRPLWDGKEQETVVLDGAEARTLGDAEFIATFNPALVSLLLDVAEAAENLDESGEGWRALDAALDALEAATTKEKTA